MTGTFSVPSANPAPTVDVFPSLIAIGSNFIAKGLGLFTVILP